MTRGHGGRFMPTSRDDDKSMSCLPPEDFFTGSTGTTTEDH